MDFAREEHKQNRINEIRNNGGEVVSQVSAENQTMWKNYFDDVEIWEEIEKDIKRTRSEIDYFGKAVNPEYNTAAHAKRLSR